MLRNVAEFPVSWLGIAKAGAVMVPLNVHYRSHDLGFALEHSDPTVILASQEFCPLVEDVRQQAVPRARIICTDGSPSGALPFSDFLRFDADRTASGPAVFPEQPVNIQYTSGSTGRPKGCLISHYYWCRIARIASAGPPVLDENDTVLTAQPFYYMDPQWNLAATLLAGSKLVVLDRFHPSSFWAKVLEYGVTFFYCLGMMPTALLRTPMTADEGAHKVRAVACSAIPTNLHAQLEERWGVPWYELFGMTETGGDLRTSDAEHDATVGSGCIGRPYADREIRVVDTEDHPLPRGAIGELVVRGPGLMEGYFRDPDSTAHAFRGGWFHTGDLVRQSEDGLVYYVGRMKDTIRRSGENISAWEVESVIAEHPLVTHVACIPVPDTLRGEEVKAYVAVVPGAPAEEVSPEKLVEWCSDRLAYFKVPRFWEYRDELPKTSSEKVAKAVLLDEKEDLRQGAWDALEGKLP
jgi:crotonobetaine/carnitine-CoA ligase